jgi:hypothetical protein
MVSTITDAQAAFAKAHDSGLPFITLLFSHPEIRQDTSHDGLPIVSSARFSQHVHDQMNNRWDFSTVAEYLKKAPPYDIIEDGNVLNYVTKVMKLTRGKLLQQDDWLDWQDSEYLQLNQYSAQRMFGDPVASKEDDAIFHLVWTYTIKNDGRKKAQCVCDGSMHSGMVRVLAETYANCIDQTSARLFYAIAAAKNLLVFGANVSNAFAEAPPPKQGFFIHPLHLSQVVGKPQETASHSPRSCDSHPIHHARPSQVTTSLGKTCRQNPPRDWPHAYGSRTLSLLWRH